MHSVQCPSVKAIEYHPNGKVRRVEFKTAADYWPWHATPALPNPLPWPSPGWIPPTTITTTAFVASGGIPLPN